MRKEDILAVLNDWNFWKKELSTGTERADYLEKARSCLKTNMILTIVGARRTGKSYIMRQLARNLTEAHGANNTLFVNLEDGRFVERDVGLLDAIFETYLEYLKPDKKPHVFLDEVHRVSGWERWARTASELRKARVVVSGSTAKLISSDLATLLTGRHLDLTVFPLSFREFLRFRGVEVAGTLDLVSRKTEVRSLLREYLEFGGFPEVVLSDAGIKAEILRTYFDDIVDRDVVIRHHIKKVDKLLSLAKFYLTNAASPVTFTSLEKFLKINAGTLERFTSHLEDAFLIFFIRRLSFSVKEQDRSPRKVYCIDTGLCNAAGFRAGENLGKVMENTVAVELRRRMAENPSMEVYYWKSADGREVDFVLREGLKITNALQVCWDVGQPEARRRELGALVKCLREVELEEGTVITNDYEGEERFRGKTILYRPLWKWLLGG